MSDDHPPPAKPTLTALDSPSSYIHASKQDKAAIKAAYSEIFRIPKKKRKSDVDEGGEDTTTTLSSPKKKKEDVKTEDEEVKMEEEVSPSKLKRNEDDPMSILRKGDLVRLDSE